MTDLTEADDPFFSRSEFDRGRLPETIDDALRQADDGELFCEYHQTESIVFDDGRVKTATEDTSQGFGLRAIAGETTGYAHSSLLTDDALRRATNVAASVCNGYDGLIDASPPSTNRRLYTSDNPVTGTAFAKKIATLEHMDAYARRIEPRVRQVTASLVSSLQSVHVLRPGGRWVHDVRPLVRMGVSVVLEHNGRRETGSHGCGGRVGWETFIEPESCEVFVDEAIRQAVVNLESVPAPAGEMIVVLGPGWPGILLHEAIGHGLEGDFNRKKTSAFSGLLGESVASSDVTVVDDGTIVDRRGSLSIDDEGTPSRRTVLIENGVLKGFLQDRLNARLMGTSSTGNGRRQSYAHRPMPRMTNTYMLPGPYAPDDIIQSVDNGLYAVAFGGGQVDITSGKFVFSCTEAYRIEGGRIGAPVKGATLIGNGPDVLTRVSMVGNDLKLDPGIGTCGKDGQSVPVGVGQPTLRIDGLTVGGTAV